MYCDKEFAAAAPLVKQDMEGDSEPIQQEALEDPTILSRLARLCV
jgi:hypothetical protein